MFRISLAAVAALALCLPAVSHAAKVKTWHHHASAHFEKAKFSHAVVSSEGTLRLGRQVQPLAKLGALHVWDVVEDRAGNLFVATGDEGKIFKLTPDGTLTTAYTSEDNQVFCLAAAPDGSIYAGTGPNGTVVRLAPDGTAKVLHTFGQTYVWSLVVAGKDGSVFAGTGPKGTIYQLTSDGTATLFHATRQGHVLCLTQGHDGLLYAGTDKGGLVYRIDAAGKGFVLCSLPQGEVRKLLATPEGVYAITSVPTRRRGGAASTTPSPAADGGKGTPAPSIPAPGTGENSLYRVSPDGTVRELFREKAMLLSLYRDKGRVLLGTGMDGQLFDVDESSREYSEIARFDHGQIHCLCRRRDGSLLIGTGDPGNLYALQDKFAARGTVVSEVLDAKMLSKWGSLRWQADTPPGTRVTIAARAGNVAEPDDTWSDWSAEQANPSQAVLAAPAARFLQYRVTLTTDHSDRTPALRELTLSYRTANLAPEVKAIDVPNLDATTLDGSKKMKLKWTATDPNEDELTYSLHIRKEGWKDWVRLEEELEKKEYEWDTTTTPAGLYQLKVVASDRRDNAAAEALTGERVSGLFAVAHVPPSVTVKFVGLEEGQAVFEASATDPLVRLTAASFAVDGKKWVNVFPTDGLFDSKAETFRFQCDGLTPGSHVLVLRVRDAAGNIGSGDVVFETPERK